MNRGWTFGEVVRSISITSWEGRVVGRNDNFVMECVRLLALGALASMGLAAATARGQTTLLSEDFEDSFPPDGWITKSKSGFPWQLKGTGYKSKHSAGITASTDEEDSWMITRGLKLDKGVKYTVSYWRKSTTIGSDDASYRLRLGTSQDPDKLQIPIASSSFVNGRWARRTQTFTPPATGTYYLGFHCNSSDWQSNGLFIDDVRVTH